MATDGSSPQVPRWLRENGWAPDRDIGERASELIDVRMIDAERQGAPLLPVEPAVEFVHRYGLLRLAHPKTANLALVINPTVGYAGDAAEISELADDLGKMLFPVGYEASEYGLILVDEEGRFFHLHHTGAYFLGSDENDTFERFLKGVDAPDAEDFFV
ncbi:SUKH-3 domain-containing protein [Streptomyces sp. NPDC006649]|uniref:SUKH-3 domain-containing protein n=1 Tax=Streptomyces sp. NPDC006649 TaxID=3156896 RepID=UPI0033AA2ADB